MKENDSTVQGEKNIQKHTDNHTTYKTQID